MCNLFVNYDVTEYTFEKNAITSYRAFHLENHIMGVHIFRLIQALPVLTKYDRGRLKVTAESNEEKKNVG